MTTFVALYRGSTVASAKLIAVSASPELVAAVVEHLLSVQPEAEQDAVVERLEAGKRWALRTVQEEMRDA